MEYIVLESRLNNHSIEELSLFSPFVQVKVDALKEKYGTIIDDIMTPIEMERIREIKGLYLKNDGTYLAEKSLNGKNHYIKRSKDKRLVVKALAEFCIKHNLDL